MEPAGPAARQSKLPWQNQPGESAPPWAKNSHSRTPSAVVTSQ